MKSIIKILSAAALLSALTLSGCGVRSTYVGDYFEEGDNESFFEEDDNQNNFGGDGESADGDLTIGEDNDKNADAPTQSPIVPDSDVVQETDTEEQPTTSVTPSQPEVSEDKTTASTQPAKSTVTYIKVTADSVNLRTGAGTSYKIAGTAEKSTLYANLGKIDGWYKTYYKNSTVYISAKYCTIVEMTKSASEAVEKVIAEGTKLMGVKYVYGATRYHDGTGNKLSGFTTTAFDCSSLMQYIFYKGANVNLQVNTRTQIYQGTTVKKSNLKRGDLIFFTNDSRKNYSGIERVGHVALYLGDNLILHTASDYAKIEEISTKRWSYYIQAQRMI
jgi:cell wall-associated NlpC family hydrolase